LSAWLVKARWWSRAQTAGSRFVGGAQDLTLAPDESAWSDAVAFDVKAFQRLAVSLDITSASDVSMDTLALVTTYRAAGHRAADTSANGFVPDSS
jgi:hypothetical protein